MSLFDPIYDAIASRVAAVLQPQFDQLKQEITTMSQSVQADIDAVTAKLISFQNSLTAAVQNIQSEIAALQQNNPGVNTSALDAAVAGLQNEVDAVSAIAPPAPPPAA